MISRLRTALEQTTAALQIAVANLNGGVSSDTVSRLTATRIDAEHLIAEARDGAPVPPVPPLSRFTLVGYWQSDPTSPEVHVIDAASIPDAITAAEREANDGKPLNPLDPYVNAFVFAGEPECLSTWAG